MSKFSELYRYFDKHRIYLPEEVCTSIENLIENVRSPIISYGVLVTYEDHLRTADLNKQQMEALDSGIKAFENELPATRKSLENEFRSLLGATAEALQRKLEDLQR